MTGFTSPEEEEEEEDNDFDTSNDDFFFDKVLNPKQRGKTNKFISRKEPRLFPTTLNKIDEVDESRIKSPEVCETEEEKHATIMYNEMDKDENGNVKIVEDTLSEKVVPQSPHVMWKSEDEVIHIDDNKRKKQRPKSANCISTTKNTPELNVRKRPNSSCAFFYPVNEKPSKIPVSTNPKHLFEEKQTPKSALKTKKSQKTKSDSDSTSSCSSIAVKQRPRSAGAKLFSHKDTYRRRCSSWDEVTSDEVDSLLDFEDVYPMRPTSACGLRTGSYATGDYLFARKAEWIPYSGENLSTRYTERKCHSNPNISKVGRKQKLSFAHCERDLSRFKRSLRLLGLEPSEFGIFDCDSESAKHTYLGSKLKHVEPTFSTKIMKRSMSLDCLREAVKQASVEDCLDISQRRLLAQAVYEEWYFKKAEEACKSRQMEKTKNERIKAKLEKEFLERKAKAEEHFQRWIETKEKSKKEKSKDKATNKMEFRVQKTKEEAEKAYREWKKEKDKELEKKNKQKQEDEERKRKEEEQKEEKKALAEKAFLEWKRKFEETQKNDALAKLEKEKKQKELEDKNKSQQGRLTSFQTWKELKDEEIKKRLQKTRNAAQLTNAKRAARVAERLYEAEQAFEEWLDKVELRKNKQLRHIIKVRGKSAS